MKEIRVWFYFCGECGYKSDAYLSHEEAPYKDECPQCHSHIELESDFTIDYE